MDKRNEPYGWLAPIIFFAVMLGGDARAFAQELKARAVEPIRVALTLAEDDSDAEQFNQSFRAELNKTRRLIPVSSRVDFDIYVRSGAIVAGERIVGHAASVAVVTAGAKDEPITVMLIMGPNLKETARLTAIRINEEFFDKR